jgi:hypothetical protein
MMRTHPFCVMGQEAQPRFPESVIDIEEGDEHVHVEQCAHQ